MSVRRHDGSRHAVVALLFAVLIGSMLSWCIAHMPMTVYDGVGPILEAQRSSSPWATFVAGLSQRGYLRPLRVAQIKVAYDLGRGNEFAAYKAIHAALTVAACALFAALLAPATSIELVSALVATTIFIGHHSFFVLVGEEYPINHFLEIVVLALGIAVLAKRATPPQDHMAADGVESRPVGRSATPAEDGAWWSDVLALVALTAGLLTLESGVLLWVVMIGGRMLGWRGISRRATIAATLFVVAFLVWRVGVLHIAPPGLDERASGFGLRRLEPAELMARFGTNPLPFYAYNVAAAVLTVLFSEPRGGTFVLVRQWLAGDVPPWMVSHVVSSGVVTTLIAAFTIAGRRRVWHGRGDDRDRLLWLALLMVVANAGLSYGYAKDEILSVAAAFYAAAAYAALSACGDRLTQPRRPWLAILVIPAFVVSTQWSLRTVGTFYGLRSFAEKTSEDWADFSLGRDLPEDGGDPRSRALFERLREVNLSLRVPNSFFTDQRDVERLIDVR